MTEAQHAKQVHGGNGQRPLSPEEMRHEINQTRERLSSTLDRIGEQLEQKRDELRQKADFVRPLRDRVRESPLPTLGVAFAAGIVVGLLRGSRRGDADGAEVLEREVPVYVEAPPDAQMASYDHAHAAHHSFLHELRSVVLHQVSNAVIAAIAGLISAKVAQHDEEETHRRRRRTR